MSTVIENHKTKQHRLQKSRTAHPGLESLFQMFFGALHAHRWLFRKAYFTAAGTWGLAPVRMGAQASRGQTGRQAGRQREHRPTCSGFCRRAAAGHDRRRMCTEGTGHAFHGIPWLLARGRVAPPGSHEGGCQPCMKRWKPRGP